MKIISIVTEVFNVTCEELWSIITDNTRSEWRSDLASIEIVSDTQFIEHDTHGHSTKFTITDKDEYHCYKFSFESANMTGLWTGELTDEQGRVSFTSTEEVHVSNIIMKLLAKTYLRKMQRQYMQDLRQKISKE